MRRLTSVLAIGVLVVLFFLSSAAAAGAETVTLYPSADTIVFSLHPNSDYTGNSGLGLIHQPNGWRAHFFVLFNLDSVPAGSRIDSAALHLYVTQKIGSNYDVPVYRGTEAWPTIPTWNNQPSVTGPVTETVFSAPLDTWQSIDLTGLVQGWANGDYPNFGLKIGLPVLMKTTVMFEWATPSKEDPTNWPTLEINYTIPAAPESETEATSSSTTGTSTGSTEPTPTSSAQATGSQITKVKTDRIKTSSAYVTWATDVDSNSYVEYGENDKYGKTTGKDDRAKTHSVQLIELKPDKTYHFRVKSTNADGHQVVSKDYVFRTAREIKPAETKKPKEKSNVWFWVAIGGLGLLVLLLAGILVFLYIRNRRLKNPQSKF